MSALTDVRQTVEYSTDTWLLRRVPLFLLLCLLGLAFAVYVDSQPRLAGWVLLAVGTGLTGYALYRCSVPGKPTLVLSPQGLLLRLGWRVVGIPWREVQGVQTTDLRVRNWLRPIPPTVKLPDCTVVLVPRTFYEQHIHIDSAFQRGPAWDSLFIPKGRMMQIALHHEQLSVAPEQVREPIEARWRAFRDQPGISAATSEPGPALRLGRGSLAATPWDAMKLATPLIGILVVLTNIAGVWETSTQEAARTRREQSAEEARREREARARDKKKWDDLRKDIDENFKKTEEFWKQFERDFKVPKTP